MVHKEYTTELKNVKTYEELMDLFKKAGKEGFYPYMKRSRHRAFSFDELNGDRVSYLIDDGVSTGCSKICNLHRNMRFEG